VGSQSEEWGEDSLCPDITESTRAFLHFVLMIPITALDGGALAASEIAGASITLDHTHSDCHSWRSQAGE